MNIEEIKKLFDISSWVANNTNQREFDEIFAELSESKRNHYWTKFSVYYNFDILLFYRYLETEEKTILVNYILNKIKE